MNDHSDEHGNLSEVISESKAVLIAGAGTYGYWNAGDEAIFAAMVADLKDAIPSARISVISDNPPGAWARYNVTEVPLSDLSGIVAAVEASDLLILGGGGLFFDYWGVDLDDVLTSAHGGIAFYLGFALLASLMRKPLMVYGAGVGPLTSEAGRMTTRHIFEQAELISVRDHESAALLSAIGIPIERVRIVSDPAFGFQAIPDDASRTLMTSLVGQTASPPIIGVALRDWTGEAPSVDWEGEVAAALDSFLDQHGGTALFIPLHRRTNTGPGDSLVAVRVRSRMRFHERTAISPEEHSPEAKAGLLGQCDLVIGMRLHALIFALSQGVPAVALSYDPKVSSVLSAADSGYPVINLSELSGEWLATHMEKAYRAGRRTATPDWVALRSRLVGQAQESARLAVDLLARTPQQVGIRNPAKPDPVLNILAKRALTSQALVEQLREATAKSELADGKVVELHDRLGQATAERDEAVARSIALESSLSWRLTGPLRRVLQVSVVRGLVSSLGTLGRQVVGRMAATPGRWLRLPIAFVRAISRQGFRQAFEQTRQYCAARSSHKDDRSIADPDERYQLERGAQSGYLVRYLAGESDVAQTAFYRESIEPLVRPAERVLLHILSYPNDLTQRPHHVMRYLASRGFVVLVLNFEHGDPFLRPQGEGVYLTNVLGETLRRFRDDRRTVLYLTWPFHAYVADAMPEAITLYDVLDDLSVFSLNCDSMRQDHERLLDTSKAVMFSSQLLYRRDSAKVRGTSHLVTNGVWPADFAAGIGDDDISGKLEVPEGATLIGYHGAISELLDWALLDALLRDRRIWLTLIGPLAQFDQASLEPNAEARARVLSSERVIHIPTVPYAALKQYLTKFDAAIVPFVVNQRTDPVSPLKLFEYMAMNLKVFATPTVTLKEYAKLISVADRDVLPREISKWIDSGRSAPDVAGYRLAVEKVEWSGQLAPVVETLDRAIRQRPTTAPRPRRVDIVNVNFFDWDGEVLYRGGAERYVFDLACILRSRGWIPRIVQNANRPFQIDFRGISVVGLPTGCGTDMRGLSKSFRDACQSADLIIASPLDLACEFRGCEVVGINHGIYWDHRHKRVAGADPCEHRNIFDALANAAACVCVDTNFINWVRTYDFVLGQKLRYVPNYFDGSVFHPVTKDFSGKLRILYPRRLYEPRGIFITLKAFDYLFAKHQDIELHLVGQANDEDRRVVLEFIAKHPGKVLWEEFDMDDMYQVYQTSHMALIPTLFAEGTSLSCLEAMATNNAVIATNVGGLPNLVVDGFNGRLIEPRVESLVEAIDELLADRPLLAAMAARGTEFAAVFEKEKWTARWESLIASFEAQWRHR
jgi:polysaccharide pyruvyl transferase CsaB